MVIDLHTESYNLYEKELLIQRQVLKTVQSNEKFTQDPIKKQLSFGQEQSFFIFLLKLNFTCDRVFFGV